MKNVTYYKKLIDEILFWLDSNIDEADVQDYGKCTKDVMEALAIDSADLKEKIQLVLEDDDYREFGEV